MGNFLHSNKFKEHFEKDLYPEKHKQEVKMSALRVINNESDFLFNIKLIQFLRIRIFW